MTTRVLVLKENDQVTKCPKCGNNKNFIANSDYCDEDCCAIWVVCKDCNYDPTTELTLFRFEDVWGGVHDDNVNMAFECWNDAIKEILRKNK